MGPESVSASAKVPVLGFTSTTGATIRYTVDGSRPTDNSPILPKNGLPLVWPGPNIVVNMRAFKVLMSMHVSNGNTSMLQHVRNK